jgi:hypothetical protein
VFLVGLHVENDGGSPRAIAWLNPTVVQQNLYMGHDDGSFMRTVVRFATTDWGRAAGIHTKFKANDGVMNAFGIKTVPVLVDNGDDFMTSVGVDVQYP